MLGGEVMDVGDTVGELGGGPTLKERTEEAGIENSANIQVLHFDGSYGNHDIRLLELTKELAETLKKEKQFVLRGEEGEDAVLCTGSQSYEVRECTTSNSLLLCPDLERTSERREQPTIRHITATNFTYYELKLCRAKLDKMRNLLKRSAFRGEECEGGIEGKVTMQDLLSLIQASEQEIRAGLDEIGAIELDGYWRTVETEYQTSVMSRVLMLLVEKEWSWERVPLIEACQTLEELQPLFVTELCLRLYGTQVEESGGEVFIRLSEDKVCRFYAEYILSSSAGMFHLSEFLEVWRDALPEGMEPTEEHLRGIALVTRDTIPRTVSYLPLSDLPVDPAARFNYLFSRQERWHQDDIIPYLQDLKGPGQTVNALLLKHCRCTTDHASKQKIYNSRHRPT